MNHPEHQLTGPANAPEAQGPLRRFQEAPAPWLETRGFGDPDSLGVSEYLRLLRRHLGLIVLVTAAGAGAAALVTTIQPRLYQSVASLEIEGVNDDFLNLRDVRPTASHSGQLDDTYVETQAEALRQDSVIERAIKRLPPAYLEALAPRPLSERIQERVLGRLRGPGGGRDTVLRIKNDLRIEPARQSRIIRISYDATDPRVAADFVNAVAQSFIDQTAESRRHAAEQIREWLAPQLEASRRRLDGSQAGLDTFLRDSGLIVAGDQENIAEARLRLVQEELSKAEADRIAKLPLYDFSREEHSDPPLDNAVLRDYRMKLTELRKQLADLDSILTPQNYKVVRLKAQIAALESAVAKERDAARRQVRREYEAARTRETMLANAYGRQSGVAASVSRNLIHYEALKQEVAAARRFYESMLQKVNDASVASAIRPSNVVLIGPGRPAPRPYKPNLPVNLAVGVCAGVFLGVGCATLRDRPGRRPRAPGDVEIQLNLPELEAIPSAASLPDAPRGIFGLGSRGVPVERVAWERKSSRLSESFRSLSASVVTLGRDRDKPRVLVITSALPGEGKTTVASNLAITLAQVNSRVLLIDSDMRRPRLHRIFDVANTWGLSNLLRGTEGLPVESMVRKTAIPGLFVLPSGPGAEDIFSLLLSDRLPGLIDSFRKEFEYVILDAPPALEFADARLLGQVADGLLLVLRANHTDNRAALLTIQRLVTDGVKVLGTVLNAWEPDSTDSYGYEVPYGWRAA